MITLEKLLTAIFYAAMWCVALFLSAPIVAYGIRFWQVQMGAVR